MIPQDFLSLNCILGQCHSWHIQGEVKVKDAFFVNSVLPLVECSCSMSIINLYEDYVIPAGDIAKTYSNCRYKYLIGFLSKPHSLTSLDWENQ